MTYKIIDVHKQFDGIRVLDGITMEAAENQLICILGPSGCGKTTLLNMMAGLIEPDSGRLEGFNHSGVSYLFQENRLLPWMTVEQNIDFALSARLPKKKRPLIVDKYMRLVGLEDYRHYLPRQLSGGMKQRAAIARAFAYPSDLLLMDEPFTGLDLPLKSALIQECLLLWRMDRRSVFYVTHDIREALTVGDCIYVFSERPASVKARFDNDIPLEERFSPAKEEQFRQREIEIFDLLRQPRE